METQGLRVYEPLLTIVEGRLALTRIVTSSTAVALTLLCILGALMVDAFAGPLERVEFESASQRLISGGLIRGDRIHGYLAKPDGTGPFPALSDCTAAPECMTRQSNGWPTNLSPGVTSSCWSTAMQRVT